MKNAPKHAEQIKSLCRKLVKDHKPGPLQPIAPLDALVRGAMSYDVTDTRAEEAMRLIQKEFVDLNELRVATDLEIQEMLGQRYPQIEQRVAMITQSLNNIFEREHTLSLDRLKELSKRDARQFLRELPDIHPFVEAYVMLYSLQGHAFPIDNTMLDFLKEQDGVEPDSSLQDAQKLVENTLKDEDCYNFFSACRTTVMESGKKKAK